MKFKLNFTLSFIISFMFLSCNNFKEKTKLNNDYFIKNLVFSGNKNRINFYKIKAKQIINKNTISYVYYEKHEFQTYDSLTFKKDDIYFRGIKLLKIDSINMNFKNKIIKINKLIYPNNYTPNYLIFYVSKDIGIISEKSNYNQVHIFYDIENNFELNNVIVKHNFLKSDLEAE